MEFSSFGKRFARHTGARELMDDLGAAMASDRSIMMLGGGNPAHIPEVLDRFAGRIREIAADPREFRRMAADYASPAGEVSFREALARLLSREYGWPVGLHNIALTGGSQSGFFQLFNLLAGNFDDGSFRRILLPMTPEYVGYADLGIDGDIFVASKPTIEHLDGNLFKYHVDFEHLQVGDEITAICVSRPTNPTGNVLTDEEVGRLAELARERQVPLIIDGAYGVPFPQIVFRDVRPFWDDNIILCLSLSKIGLPAMRTGIVVACEEIIDALTSLNAIMSLAVSSVGPVLVRDLVDSGEIIRLSRDVVRPFYRQRAEQALAWMRQALAGCPFHIHTPEGALFLWLWLPELRVTSEELYQRLKARDCYVLSGHHFFPGLEEAWPHRHQCIRVTYARDSGSVRRGIEIIGDEIRRLCG
jgi:valine--pyruvate aminotransferase